MATKTRKIVYAQKPQGAIQESHFEHKEDVLPELKEGEILTKLTWLSFDPAQRIWMRGPSYRSELAVGGPMEGLGVVEVIESKSSKYQKGDNLSGGIIWQEYIIFDEKTASSLHKVQDPSMALNICGLVGLTAYFGLINVGKVAKGDVVLVSSAAGATGLLVAQIAKIKGASKVIGIAGGKEKCSFLLEKNIVDAAIDYKSENVRKRIHELAPQGVNVYFDNVGGEILEAALDNLALRARIVCCGSISAYESTESYGVKNLFHLVSKRGTMEGFIVIDFAKDFPTAISEMVGWHKEGKLQAIQDVQEGWENIPKTFLRLFKGENIGKQLLKV